ncbi:TetR/AcrR family transcriptional regulator [Litorilituus sediminis]|uniref:TetR/AcrR family transcriptional regulator n=1 Tax=Litorilituus sediminis TaxID=718192 RepID=A0A4P6PCY9_9GAMM|nr:TetR/AcrR family transcriptional regulator [Litorilituus sediminis]QBG37642.1 TetR/AcrR family transcriptional regulator [Litorilituus sediminis]
MTPRIIDDTALQAREELIIDSAVKLIAKVGIENLTMDKVVAQVPFSKGTVYKHFEGKEDLLLAISNRAIKLLAELFIKAFHFEGCARERMLLANFSYLLYAILYPELFQTCICAKAPNVVGKSSAERIQEQEVLETKLMGAIFGIFEEAIANESLTLPAHMDLQQLTFANWSMAYGTIALLSAEVEQCSGRTNLVVERELFNQSNLLFDGLQWQPLTKDKMHCDELRKALEQVYPVELRLIKEKGRELKF